MAYRTGKCRGRWNPTCPWKAGISKLGIKGYRMALPGTTHLSEDGEALSKPSLRSVVACKLASPLARNTLWALGGFTDRIGI